MTDANAPVQGADVLELVATRPDVADAVLRVSVAAGLYAQLPGPTQVSVASAAPIVPWRSDTVVTTKVPIFVDQLVRPNWFVYESQRTFWRTIPELLRSHGVLKELNGLPPARSLQRTGAE